MKKTLKNIDYPCSATFTKRPNIMLVFTNYTKNYASTTFKGLLMNAFLSGFGEELDLLSFSSLSLVISSILSEERRRI